MGCASQLRRARHGDLSLDFNRGYVANFSRSEDPTEQDDKKIISITRWGIFTKTILEISDKNIDVKEIGGNDEIVVSVLAHKNQREIFIGDQLLYRSNVVIDADREKASVFVTCEAAVIICIGGERKRHGGGAYF